MIPVSALNEWLVENNLPDAYSVNNGGCENFAIAVQDFIPGSDIIGTDNVDGWDSPLPGHIWLTDGSKHYDSEALDGVVDWKDLPIFKRAIARGVKPCMQ